MIIKIKDINDLNNKDLKKKISTKGFVILRGLFNKKEIRSGLMNLKKKFKSNKDLNSISGNSSEIMKNFQKICIGSSSRVKLPEKKKIYRFHRIIYNPIWSLDIYKLRDIFLKFCGIRNKILNFKWDYGTSKIEKNIWSATRILQYPSGGGYMSCHQDFFAKNVNKKNNIKFYQFILNLTEFNRDFSKGGAYIKKKEKIIFLEKYLKSGDILIYNGNSQHGVSEIDPHKKLNIKDLNGRIILMNSFYQTKIKKYT